MLWCIKQAKKYAKDENEFGTCWFAEQWLEKQGIKEISELAESEDKQIMKEIAEFIYNSVFKPKDIKKKEKWLTWFEKQGEKANEIELKFKVGDWIVATGKIVYQISAIYEKKGYVVLTETNGDKGTYTISVLDDAHLWGISDAKDGDVLTASDGSVFIFASTFDCGCKHYIALTKDGQININKGMEHFWETARGVCPATKEERTLLFEKMREAGYRWDSEEKRPIRTPKPQEPTGVLKQLLDEEAKWSEEDESFVNDLANYFTATDTLQHDEYVVIAWLKALKRRFMAHLKDNSPQL